MAHLAGIAPLIWNENVYCCFAGLPIQVYSGPCCASVWQALWQAVRAGINGANLRMTLHWRGAVLSWDYMSAIAISPHDTCYGLLHIGNRFMQEKFLFIGSHPIFICVFFRTELQLWLGCSTIARANPSCLSRTLCAAACDMRNGHAAADFGHKSDSCYVHHLGNFNVHRFGRLVLFNIWFVQPQSLYPEQQSSGACVCSHTSASSVCYVASHAVQLSPIFSRDFMAKWGRIMYHF